MRTRRGARLALAASVTGLVATAGCTSMANLVLPVSEERDLGRRMEADLARELPLVQDPAVVGYIRELGERIAAAAGEDVPEGIRFEFDVVDDDETVNAFAIPGGHIYIYTGLLRLVEDEAELLGVVAHEVAHVTQRHIARQLTARLGFQTVLAALSLGLVPGPTALLTELASTAVAEGTLLKYSRDSEREADRVGLGYEARAGWDPRGMLRFFQKLTRLHEDPGFLVFLQTHPASAERLEDTHEAIADLGRIPTFTGRERYQAFLQRLGPARAPPAAK